jgi:peptidyl-tRNA hydrolase, PTH1 family
MYVDNELLAMANPLRMIVGLGNPGGDYAKTRHNAGFWYAERLAELLRIEFRNEPKFHALVASTRIATGDYRIAMPQTFMNRSGMAVGALARFYRVLPAEILVVHDELDMKPGAIKLKHGGGTAGHNGLRDIAAEIGTGDFWRLRIGIGHPRDGALTEQEVADYVLHAPRSEEKPLIDDAIARALAVWPRLESGEIERAMHELHTKPREGSPEPASGERRKDP